MNSETIYVNGEDIRSWGVQALRDYRIGGTEITNYQYQGVNRSNFVHLFSKYGLKTINFILVFTGDKRRVVEEHRSNMTARLYGVNDLLMPDEFHYRVLLQEVGEGEWRGQEGNGWLLLVPYTLVGIQHDALVTIEDGRTPFYVEATLPKMDCILSVKVDASTENYMLGGANFGFCEAGDELVFDGINKRILRNRQPATASGYFEFPYVVPGHNAFEASDPVKVEYYPCYF